MSNSTASSYTPQEIAGLQALQLGSFINVSLLALVLYEYAITFSQEIEVIWCYGGGKNSLIAAMVFLANRYSALMYGIVGFIAGLAPLTTTCDGVTRFTEVIVLSLTLSFAFFSSYRVYALQVWKYKLLSVVVFLLNLVPFVVNLYAFSRYTTALIGPAYSPCVVIDPLTLPLEISFVRACRLSAIAADALVLSLTLAKTVPHWIEARKLKIAVPLSTALIQDGSAYFFILLLMNIFQMITFAVWETEFLTTFIYILTPVLSCRLIFNLRQLNQPRDDDNQSLHLQQLDDRTDSDIESKPSDAKEMRKVPSAYDGMDFYDLNLDAFNNISDSSTDSDSSSSSGHGRSPMKETSSIHEIQNQV